MSRPCFFEDSIGGRPPHGPIKEIRFCQPSIEEALDLIYRGKNNVAVKAEELDIPTETLKRLVREYILERPLDTSDPKIWSDDVDLSWPWV